MLLDSGSLSVFLEKYCNGDFNLQLVRQSWQRPLPDEAKVLFLGTGKYALLREIYLRCGDTPLVYGRSIIPVRTFTGAERRLARWGQRPLGDYLFTGKNTWRTRIEITQITPVERLFNLAKKNISFKDTVLWGRRSIFYIKNKPLLIVEVFLPEIIRCIKLKNK
jgi:chorismate lyase